MESLLDFFGDCHADPINSVLRQKQVLEKTLVKHKNAVERASKKRGKEPIVPAAVAAAKTTLEETEKIVATFDVLVDALKSPSDADAEKLTEYPFAREKTRLLSIHPKYIVSATCRQAGNSLKDQYTSAKAAREQSLQSFQINPSPAVKQALETKMKDSEFAAYMDAHFEPTWSYDAVNDVVPTKSVPTGPEPNAKKMTVAIEADTNGAKYDDVTKLGRVFVHLFKGVVGDKACNFRSKARSDLSFLFSWQMVTGLDVLPDKGSKEAVEIAEKLQSALYCVSSVPTEPLLAAEDGLPVPATKAMRTAAKTNTLFARDEDTQPPSYQLMYSLSFPDQTKLQHGFAEPLDGRFFSPVTTKVAKFVADAVTKLVGEEAIVPALRPYLSDSKSSKTTIELAAVASELSKQWTYPKTEADLSKESLTNLASAWLKEPFANPYINLIKPDGSTVRILSGRDLPTTTFFEDCLLQLHALDSEQKTSESLKSAAFKHMQHLELVAFESTGVERSMSFTKAQSRALTLEAAPKKRKSPGTDKAMVAVLTKEVEELRNELRLKQEELEDKEAEVEMLRAKRSRTTADPNSEKMLRILTLAFPNAAAKLSAEDAA